MALIDHLGLMGVVLQALGPHNGPLGFGTFRDIFRDYNSITAP